MSRQTSRWHMQRLRKAQLTIPGNGEESTTQPNNEHSDKNDDDDIDDSLPGAYAISNEPFNQHQMPLWESNHINTSTIDPLLHDESSSNNENMAQSNDDIPNWLDLNQDHIVAQPSLRNGLNTNKQIFCALLLIVMVLSVIAIVSTIVVTQVKTHQNEETTSFCYLDKKEMVQCRFGILEVPSCANTTFQELAMDLLDGKYSHSYPCDSRHFGLVAVAIAQVNEEDPIENILQYWIMAIFYFSMGGYDWRNNRNWLTGNSPCHADWYGLSCSKDNYIQEIELLSNNLVGTLPLEIMELTSIQNLNLNSAYISGTLPTEIGKMRSLSALNLELSLLAGTIPTEIGLCKNLQFLNLLNVALSGIVPMEIGSLLKLTYLALPNRVEGMLPTELGLLLNLRSFDLVNMMSLEDSILSQLSHFSNLSMLRISNSFTDDIVISNLLSFLPTNLESLYLGGSNIKGQIPNELSSFDRITSLEIVESRLTGTLPSDIGSMTELQILRITGSLLKGNIPSEIGRLSHLTCLDLSSNQFSILMPSEVSKFTNLKSYCQ